MSTIYADGQTGWSFPPAFKHASRNCEMTGGLDNLARSLKIMMATEPGERTFYQEYGCSLQGYSFQSISRELIEQVEETIERSIRDYEPRLAVHELQVLPDPDKPNNLYVFLQYTTAEGEVDEQVIAVNADSAQSVAF